eukprot:ANDGO_00369.mRNA.1 General negative regulator of transcription subunit 4
MYDDSSDGANECPLCLEEMDATDMGFKPCVCGYKICIWCWNQINERFDGRCPNCRREYDTANVQFEEVYADSGSRESQKLKKKKSTGAVSSGSAAVSAPRSSSFSATGFPASGANAARPPSSGNPGLPQPSAVPIPSIAIPSRRDLANVRVIQRNLVYVVGLPPSLAREDLLRSPEYFSQYGKILKLVVNKPHSQQNPRSSSFSAYVTFAEPIAARAAIENVDGVVVDDRTIKASFGTTKYCSYFLRGIQCTNPECMYLHDLGDETDTFTKEDMILRKASFQNSIHPPSHPENDLWQGPGFPPVGRDAFEEPYYDESEEEVPQPAPVQSPTVAQAATASDFRASSQEWPTIQSASQNNRPFVPKTPVKKLLPSGAQTSQLSSNNPFSQKASTSLAVGGVAPQEAGASVENLGTSAIPTSDQFSTAGRRDTPVCAFFRHIVPMPRASVQWAAMNAVSWSFSLLPQSTEFVTKSVDELLPEVLSDYTRVPSVPVSHFPGSVAQ